MKIYNILLISLISINILFGQKKEQLSSETLRIVENIESFKYISILFKGDDPYSRNKRMKSSDEQYKNFISLKNNASTKELVTLCNHPNTNVRCYAFLILSEDNYSDLTPIIKNHITDYEIINFFVNGNMGKQMVGDFFIKTAEPFFQSSAPLKKDLEEVYKTLYSSHNKLKYKHRVLSTHRLTPELYPWLRFYIINNLYNENGLYLDELLPLLASYQRKEDLLIFVKNIKKHHKNNTVGGYNAVEKFSDQIFMPFIILDLDKVPINHIDRIPTKVWSDLFKATAAFKNKEAFELLHKAIENSYDQKHLEMIYDGIMEYNDDIYEDLLWLIWQENEELFLSSTGLEYLLKKDTEKTKIYLKKYIDNCEDNVNVQTVLDRLLAVDKNIGKELFTYLQQHLKNYSDSEYEKSEEEKKEEYFLIIYRKNKEFKDLVNSGGININGLYSNKTHLEAACFANNEEIVEFLLEKGADIRYALYWSSFHKVNNTITDLLIEKGADINKQNEEGETMLHRQIMELASLNNTRRLEKDNNKRNNTNKSLEIVENQIKEREKFIKKLVVKGANPYLETVLGFNVFDRVDTETSYFLNKCLEEK